MDLRLNHINQLESEAIFVLREAASQFEKPALLFSGGKDSIVLLHLAKRAFWPGKIPFPLLHIDTGHNFIETLKFRDQLVSDLGLDLIVGSVQASIDAGMAEDEVGPLSSRNRIQSITLLEMIEKMGSTAVLVVPEETRKKLARKSGFFRIGIRSDSGIQKINAPNFGTFSTEKRRGVNTFACSH